MNGCDCVKKYDEYFDMALKIDCRTLSVKDFVKIILGLSNFTDYNDIYKDAEVTDDTVYLSIQYNGCDETELLKFINCTDGIEIDNATMADWMCDIDG